MNIANRYLIEYAETLVWFVLQEAKFRRRSYCKILIIIYLRIKTKTISTEHKNIQWKMTGKRPDQVFGSSIHFSSLPEKLQITVKEKLLSLEF